METSKNIIKQVSKEVPIDGPVILEVFNPSGAVEVSQRFASRLADLDGKTVCMLWNGLWEGDRIFPLIGELLQKRYPTVKVIPYTELPVGAIDTPEVSKIVKEKGAQAVIVGSAG